MNTESFLEGVILDGIEADRTPPFSISLSKAPILDKGYLTISPKTSNQEIFYYDGKSGATVTITARGYDSTGTNTDPNNQRKHSKNTSAFKGALNHIIIDEKVNKTDLASTSTGEGASTVGVEDAGGYFSSTDVEGALQELAQGAPGVADATETIAGKVELPTDAEFTNGTVTGATGATLTPTNAQIHGLKSNSIVGITGEVRMWTTDTAPASWLIADGSAVSRATYSDLFAVIGTTYGVGDGATTFNLPNISGRVIVGKDTGDLDFDTLGEAGGAKTDTHSHSYTIPKDGYSFTSNNAAGNNVVTIDSNPGSSYNWGRQSTDRSLTTGSTAASTVQPYLVLNYIIKT